MRAIMQVESGGRPNARSGKGAMGYMQLMPSTAKALGVKDPYDPKQNIEGAAKLLAELNKRYDGDLDLMLADYNAGRTAVVEHGGVPPYKETQNYIRKVRRAYSGYDSGPRLP